MKKPSEITENFLFCPFMVWYKKKSHEKAFGWAEENGFCDNKVEKEPKSGNYKKFELFPESGKKHENMRMFTEKAPSMISIQ